MTYEVLREPEWRKCPAKKTCGNLWHRVFRAHHDGEHYTLYQCPKCHAIEAPAG